MQIDIQDHLAPIDIDALARQFRSAEPIPCFFIDDFLRPELYRAVRDAFPSYEEALRVGQSFRAVNENKKVQVTERSSFPEPIRLLSEVLSSPDFRALLTRITGIESLLADPDHIGGGLHVMAPGGRLDVHVDFNILPERNLYRRLNILLFANRTWREDWGGAIELWDPEVKRCGFSAAPLPNRCVVFQTSETSFHGVTPIKSPKGVSRNSFAAYYYTAESPAELAGRFHSTVFRARPDEWWRRGVMMPGEKAARRLRGLGKRTRTFLQGGGSR